MSHTISNSDNVIDSRDVIARIEELESDRSDLLDALTEAQDAHNDALPAPESAKDMGVLSDAVKEAQATLQEWDEGYDGKELKVLRELADEASGCSDWTYGEMLIRDSYFEDYARDLAEDIGSISKDQSWPNNCIDWEQAADQLKQDYTTVEFDGVIYWIRS